MNARNMQNATVSRYLEMSGQLPKSRVIMKAMRGIRLRKTIQRDSENEIEHEWRLMDWDKNEVMKTGVMMTFKEANDRNHQNKLMFPELRYEWQMTRKAMFP